MPFQNQNYHADSQIAYTVWHDVFWNSCYKQIFTKHESKSQGLDQKHLLVGVFRSSQTKRFAKTEYSMEEVITIPGKGHGNQINYQLSKQAFKHKKQQKEQVMIYLQMNSWKLLTLSSEMLLWWNYVHMKTLLSSTRSTKWSSSWKK